MPLLLIDLDNTTVDRNAAYRRWVVSFCDANGLGVDDAAWMVEIDCNSEATREFVFGEICGRYGGDPARTLVEYHEQVERHVEALPGALDGLRTAKAAGWTPWVVTNGESEVQRAKLATSGVADLVDGFTISAEVGLRKPDPAIFASAARAAEIDLDGAWMIGDSAATDIGGAVAAGLRCVWITMHRRWGESRYRPTLSADRFDVAVGMVIGARRDAPSQGESRDPLA